MKEELEGTLVNQTTLVPLPVSNVTRNVTNLPLDMQFNDGHRLSIFVYSILFVFSTIANTTVLVLILKRRKKFPSRINMMLVHLSIADLMVTLLIMPLEIGWNVTVQWLAGDALCRIMMFFRTFGLYLSSFILVCIGIDRFYAVLKPLDRGGAREKIMLAVAWIAASICSVPQMLIFHVETHPNETWYYQCVSYNSFPSYGLELVYVIVSALLMYFLPFVVIIYSYASILLEIFRRTRNPIGADSVTRSSLPFLDKAKIRTLKMTIIIVFVFFVCWTPYQVMSLWYWFDRSSAEAVDLLVQKFLFLFACTNSCMNPVVYGLFNIRRRRRGKVRSRTYTNSTHVNGASMSTRTDTRLSIKSYS
ncbi:adipokinetic hormone/corazonin-related peptide receptor variant I [Diabrotica virgifera virgifera]|uniref:G-protein coupled receptors family 1 profile domain-containing protein n=2 Tax=Diabrotica virgifera virgifera TaxID=50390 RepID=A0ABM5K1B3_DIAVI|nr:adipokinetic hormone/corazonin-related peptide receptor variant I [Diabrotica virgifera virgifera]XP_050503981.1 adipokinetic hormone/corazonin-related peptide receptor variant I [Diabrotica virgifera virgifera]